jgi:hypothetical protein
MLFVACGSDRCCTPSVAGIGFDPQRNTSRKREERGGASRLQKGRLTAIAFDTLY